MENNKYKIGQTIYLLSPSYDDIMPAVILQENITKTIDNINYEYQIEFYHQNEKHQTTLESLKSHNISVYDNLDLVKNELFNYAKNKIDTLIDSVKNNPLLKDKEAQIKDLLNKNKEEKDNTIKLQTAEKK